MKKIIALLLSLTMLMSILPFAFASEATEPTAENTETTEAADETAENSEEATESAAEEEEADTSGLVPLEVEIDPVLKRNMGLAAATAVAYGVDPEEIEYYDHLTVGNPTEMRGNFFTELWGNATSDIDVRDLLHGYNLIRWDGGNGVFTVDPTVVVDILGLEEEDTGNRTYTLVLANDLYFSDGTQITAKDYAFTFLLTLSPEIAKIGAVRERGGDATKAILGSAEYMNGRTNVLAGVRIIADNAISITLDGAFLPYFFEMALMSCIPYPISEIAPGVQVADDGNGVYLTNADGTAQPAVFTAELLEQTVNGENGYRSHPKTVSGPYTLTSWDGTTAEFTKNPYYKGNANDAIALIDNLSYTLADNETMIGKLESGEFDLLNKVAYVESIEKGIAGIADENIATEMGNYPRSGLAYLAFACEKDTVSSPAVRQAIAWSLDRDAIVADYTGNYGTRVDGYLGVGQWMYGLVMGTIAPPVEPYFGMDEKTGLTYEQTMAAWETLNLDNLTVYTADPEKAKALLDEDGWTVNESGLRTKNINGKDVTLDLTLIYPEGNKIGEMLEKYLVPNLKEIGIQLTLKAVAIGEMGKWVHEEVREMDMFYMASNFDIVFDPSMTFNPYDESSVTRQSSRELYEAAGAMNSTEPGDILGYVTKWVAFEEKFNAELPVIPLYSNVYFDFYTNLLHDYNIAEHTTWGEAILGAAKALIPEYEIPMVEPETEDGDTVIGD